MKEVFIQDLIIRFPSELLDEDGLTYIGREVKTGSRRLDIVLKDRRGRHVLVEVQTGALDTKHIDRHIDFSEGYLENNPHTDVRVMFVANQIDVNKKSFLQRRGYEYKEISETQLKEIAIKKGFEISAMPSEQYMRKTPKEEKVGKVGVIKCKNVEELVEKFKSTNGYKNFRTILIKKDTNEAKAKEIMETHLGSLNSQHLRQIFDLVDEPYSRAYETAGSWFGRLIRSNVGNMLNQTNEAIKQWFDILVDDGLPASERIDLLCKTPNRITGAGVGLITLFLYLLDKLNYSVWFKAQHNGLALLYPQIGKYTGRGKQYLEFNKKAKEFAKHYSFDHTELDYIFQEIAKKFTL
jgi:hypothetical protein